jgi:putative DNA primase/helicase
MFQNTTEPIQEAVFARIEQERGQWGPTEGDPGMASPTLLSKAILKALNSNEDGDASLFVELHRGRFLFDHAAGQWYEWAGHFWKEDELNQAMAGLESVIDLYTQEAKRQSWERLKCEKAGQTDKARKYAATGEALVKRIRALQSKARKTDVLFLAAVGASSLGITGQEWDRDPWLLCCLNGVIDLRTGEHRQGRPEDFLKTVAPTEWKGTNEPAPTWERFLVEIFSGDEELVDYVQRLSGYSVTGRTVEHFLPIMVGKGRNGKGTIFETLAYVLGDYTGQIEAELILKQKFVKPSGGPTSDIMTLRGKRLVWASETDQGRKLNAGKLKWLTGGDTLTGREMYGRRQVNFRPTHKLFLLTNHKPHANSDDYALWKRLHLIPFALSFVTDPKEQSERKADPTLPDKLRAEGSGILAWLVRGCLEWQKEGLKPPETVKVATEAYREEEDLIKLFIDERCKTGKGLEIKSGDLHRAYKTWCGENEIHPMTVTAFGIQIKQRFDSYKTNVVFYVGISLNDDL